MRFAVLHYRAACSCTSLTDNKPIIITEVIGFFRKTRRIVRENVIYALLVKAVVLVHGVFVAASMRVAVFADVSIMLLAIINAMRTLKKAKISY